MGGKLPRHHLANMLKIMRENPEYEIFLWCNRKGVYEDITAASETLTQKNFSGRLHIHLLSEVLQLSLGGNKGEKFRVELDSIVTRESRGVFPNFASASASASDIMRF